MFFFQQDFACPKANIKTDMFQHGGMNTLAITAYCKKCQEDVPLGERCPNCGAKLAKSSARVAWCVAHTPVEDWMCWNSVARILLPVWLVVLVMILLPEIMHSGISALDQVLKNGTLLSMVLLLLVSALVTLLVLHLQGDDLIDCVVDSRGVHVCRYLPEPTPMKLLLRLRSPHLIQEMEEGDDAILISAHEILWKDMARVQLWPEKRLVLIYAPHWWMNLALYCTPFTWEDTMQYMRDKVGRKKNLLLPRELIAPPKPKAPRKKAAPAVEPLPEVLPLADDLAQIEEIPATEEPLMEEVTMEVPLAEEPAPMPESTPEETAANTVTDPAVMESEPAPQTIEGASPNTEGEEQIKMDL